MANQPNIPFLKFSGAAFGSRTVPSEEIDAAFGMPPGKLRDRAGILSVAHALPEECEATLATAAANATLRAAGVSAGALDWIIASSETHHAFPSLAARLHLAVGARETCGVLDVGGACLGLLYALAVAKGFVESGQCRTALVATADVHSRTLRPGRVAGEFGGLFGDGAAAFLVQSEASGAKAFALRDFFFGCASQLQAAIEVKAEPEDRLHVVFEGDVLSRAATARLDQCIRELEQLSGVRRSGVAAFATHQPNPRLVALLGKKTGIAPERFPEVARTRGNLGSSTCAAALHAALEAAGQDRETARLPIFLASLGPGLLYGGGWLDGMKSEVRK